jgi:hypothetical protein
MYYSIPWEHCFIYFASRVQSVTVTRDRVCFWRLNSGPRMWEGQPWYLVVAVSLNNCKQFHILINKSPVPPDRDSDIYGNLTHTYIPHHAYAFTMPCTCVRDACLYLCVWMRTTVLLYMYVCVCVCVFVFLSLSLSLSVCVCVCVCFGVWCTANMFGCVS